MGIRFMAAIKIALALAITSLGVSTTTLFGNHGFRTEPPVPEFAQRSGAAVFAATCARCHGSDGRAATAKGKAVGATDLTSNSWKPDTARDTRIVRGGKEEMPAFKGKLKPAEIEAVVEYIRRFKN
jgi:cytochrome c6